MKRSAFTLAVAVALSLGVSPAVSGSTPSPHAVISGQGHWFVDGSGRVVGFRGVNLVQKFPPIAPEAVGFDDDDAAFLASEGFNVVRLGVVFGAVMPQPGVIDQSYVAGIAHTTRVLQNHGIYTLLDFHQDGYGPGVHGNGFPEWATLTDGLPNPDVGFPAYYISNPALQRAFDNFWLNTPGPDGVPLQQHYAEAVRAVASAVTNDDDVLGYDIMNEPWPGTDWTSCVSGCPDLERARLLPFEQRMTTAIRSVDTRHLVFTEPFVLFNFGHTDTVVPGSTGAGNAISFHVYAASPGDEPAVVLHARARNVPALCTEYGAVTDAPTITRIANTIETQLVSWIFWSYDGIVVNDMTKPPAVPNVNATVITALDRPYARATNGTPTAFRFDAATGDFQFTYSTTRADGKRAHPNDTTEIDLPARTYPSGYHVYVTGGVVSSAANATTLVLRNNLFASQVTVRVTRS